MHELYNIYIQATYQILGVRAMKNAGNVFVQQLLNLSQLSLSENSPATDVSCDNFQWRLAVLLETNMWQWSQNTLSSAIVRKYGKLDVKTYWFLKMWTFLLDFVICDRRGCDRAWQSDALLCCQACISWSAHVRTFEKYIHHISWWLSTNENGSVWQLVTCDCFAFLKILLWHELAEK